MDNLMDGEKILEQIPEFVVRKLLYCVNKAITDDAAHYFAEFKPTTINGLPMIKGDWINSNIDREFDKKIMGANFEIIEFKRRSWKGRLIVDHLQKIVYNIINATSLKMLRANCKRKVPHYFQTLSASLNKKYVAPMKGQYSMFDTNPEIFETITLEYDFQQMAGGQVAQLENYTFCALTYTREGNSLVTANLVILDRNLNEVVNKSLDITPNFVDLTSIDYSANIEGDQLVDTKSLIKLRKAPKVVQGEDNVTLPDVDSLTAETENAPISLREDKKQA